MDKELLDEWNVECQQMTVNLQAVPSYQTWLEQKLTEARFQLKNTVAEERVQKYAPYSNKSKHETASINDNILKNDQDLIAAFRSERCRFCVLPNNCMAFGCALKNESKTE